jgi:hypothetical protein
MAQNNSAAASSKNAGYDFLIKLLLIGDSGTFWIVCRNALERS